jgi:hypothetical protein
VQAPAGPARVEAAWAELGDTARDLGLTWSETDTPRRAADALVREAGLSPTGSGAVQTLRLDIERTRYAGATSSGSARTNDALSSALDDLDAVSTRGARLRARLLPRTIWRTPGNRTR